MVLSIHISNAELSANPITGLVTGNEDPGTTRTGVLPKLVDSDDELKDDLEDHKDVFDPHDHDPANPTGGGGPPIGSGPIPGDATGGAPAIAAGGIDEAAIGPSAITGAKTAPLAITEPKIEDDSVAREDIGAPNVTATVTIEPSTTHTFSHGLGYRPACHLEYSPGLGAFRMTMVVDEDNFYVRNPGVINNQARVRYYGG